MSILEDSGSTASDYVGFSLTQTMKAQAKKQGMDFQNLPGDVQQKITQTFNELLKTTDGKKLIEQAIAGDGADKLLFLGYNSTMAITNGIVTLGKNDDQMTYKGIDGVLYNMSIPRMIVHELRHKEQGDHGTDNQEKAAINFTNEFMQRHYGEVYRDPDSYSQPTYGGSKGWDKPRFLGGGSSSLEEMVNPTKFATLESQQPSKAALQAGLNAPQMRAPNSNTDSPFLS